MTKIDIKNDKNTRPQELEGPEEGKIAGKGQQSWAPPSQWNSLTGPLATPPSPLDGLVDSAHNWDQGYLKPTIDEGPLGTPQLRPRNAFQALRFGLRENNSSHNNSIHDFPPVDFPPAFNDLEPMLAIDPDARIRDIKEIKGNYTAYLSVYRERLKLVDMALAEKKMSLGNIKIHLQLQRKLKAAVAYIEQELTKVEKVKEKALAESKDGV